MPSNQQQQPVHAFSHIYPLSNNALQTPPDSQPPSQHGPLGVNGYVLPQSPHSHHDPAQISPAHYQQQQLSEVPVSSYPDFSLPYQNSLEGHVQGLESPLIGRVNSPPERKHAFDHRNQDPIPALSERRRSVVSAGSHQPNGSNTGKNSCPQLNDSMDESEAASPSSSRSQGARGSDQSTPQTQNADSKDGNSGTPKNHVMREEAPPWSELKTKAGKERKRLPLACIACRRKKIRCSGEKPACKHCLRSRIPCVYKVTTRKAAPRTDYMAMLDKRLKRMEDRVIKIIPEQDAGKMAQIGRATVKPSLTQPPKSLATKKRPADEAFGNELEEWAQPDGSRPAGHSRQPSSSDRSENRLLIEGTESLPSREIQEHLSEVFFDYLYGQTYHLLHKPSFMRKLRFVTMNFKTLFFNTNNPAELVPSRQYLSWQFAQLPLDSQHIRKSARNRHSYVANHGRSPRETLLCEDTMSRILRFSRSYYCLVFTNLGRVKVVEAGCLEGWLCGWHMLCNCTKSWTMILLLRCKTNTRSSALPIEKFAGEQCGHVFLWTGSIHRERRGLPSPRRMSSKFSFRSRNRISRWRFPAPRRLLMAVFQTLCQLVLVRSLTQEQTWE